MLLYESMHTATLSKAKVLIKQCSDSNHQMSFARRILGRQLIFSNLNMKLKFLNTTGSLQMDKVLKHVRAFISKDRQLCRRFVKSSQILFTIFIISHIIYLGEFWKHFPRYISILRNKNPWDICKTSVKHYFCTYSVRRISDLKLLKNFAIKYTNKGNR
jgi:hypothetical protein